MIATLQLSFEQFMPLLETVYTTKIKLLLNFSTSIHISYDYDIIMTLKFNILFSVLF